MFNKLIGSLAIAAAVALGAAQRAEADIVFPSSYTYSMTVNLDANQVGEGTIYAILKSVNYPNGGGASWPSEVSVGSNVITEIFPQTQPIVSALFLGVIDQLVGEESSSGHLVLFMNPNVALSDENGPLDFTALFPNSDEAQIIEYLRTTIAFGSNPSEPDLETALDYIGNFISGDATNAGAPFSFDQILNVVAFSTGTVIGTATVSLTDVSVTDVPEPASLTLLGLGLAGLAGLRRRRA